MGCCLSNIRKNSSNLKTTNKMKRKKSKNGVLPQATNNHETKSKSPSGELETPSIPSQNIQAQKISLIPKKEQIVVTVLPRKVEKKLEKKVRFSRYALVINPGCSPEALKNAFKKKFPQETKRKSILRSPSTPPLLGSSQKRRPKLKPWRRVVAEQGLSKLPKLGNQGFRDVRQDSDLSEIGLIEGSGRLDSVGSQSGRGLGSPLTTDVVKRKI